jgi:RNA polymerase subunit RPABC4/transcription elongation factor Spt4
VTQILDFYDIHFYMCSVSFPFSQQYCPVCHSGLDPWFDMLTTLSKVEGESSVSQIIMRLDAPRIVVRGRILESGMTGRN